MSVTTIKNVTLQTVVKFPVSLPGRGVPPGGDIGDVLTKLSGDDYATEWAAPGASDNYESYPAGEAVSSGRVVIIEAGEAIYFQPSDTGHHGRAIGVTRTSAASGAQVTIQPFGVVVDAALTFAADMTLWVGANGEITDTQSSAWLVVQKAGISMENDKMLIDFSTSILKS